MLAQNENLFEEAGRISAIFEAQNEWLMTGVNSFALHSDEIEISTQNDRLFLACLTAKGWRSWRVLSWELSDEKLIFRVAPKLKSIETKLEFVPRVSLSALQADLRAARLAAAQNLAEIARAELHDSAKIERVGLNAGSRRGQLGTFARILLGIRGKTVAVCGAIQEKTDVAKLLSHSLLWLTKLEEKREISELWLVVEEKASADLKRLVALLRPGFHKKIGLYERVLEESPERKEFLKFVEKLQFEDLWREKPKKYVRAKNVGIGETARQIIGLVPDAIDLVRSRYGETLRFRGLPFVRVRKILEEERVLFGVEGKNQRILDEESLPDFERLLNDLLEHRRADTPAKNNSLFRAAPESWLESILRRDVSALDPNLILAPLHAQFRVSQKQGSLDLLALRSDGRLVVIELKVSPDREHVFQGANYWRQIELQRRRGNLQRAGLFNDLEIADAAPLVYLCAPLMSFHRDLEILAKTILPDIEIWRFDLNEDWRSGVHVARRQRIN